MNRFAFVNHYLDPRLLPSRKIERFLQFDRLPVNFLKRLITYWPPYPYMRIGPVESITGARATGIGIACPLLPEHFVTLDERKILRKIVRSGKLGERFGARIVGLGGFTSVFGNEGEEVAKCLKIAVTSGNTYTAALVLDGLTAAADLLGYSLKNCRIAVVGATGDIGSICTRILAKRVGEIALAARNEKRLFDFASELERNVSARVQVAKYTTEAVRGAHLVLTATSAITTLIEAKDLRPGSVVCDVSYPANISKEILKYRDDVLVFEGGLATWPYYGQLGELEKLQKFSPPGTLHGCLAETMLLALEGKFENFSIGRGRITEEKINEVKQLAHKHGFHLAPLQYNGIFYSTERILQIRQATLDQKAKAFA